MLTSTEEGRNAMTTTSASAKVACLACALAVIMVATNAPAAVIGLDAVHGLNAAQNLATGSDYTVFRSTITAHGDTIVPLSSFNTATLTPLDAAFFLISYANDAHPYSSAEMAAIQAFANVKDVFVSDSSMWASNAGNDRPITFGDNQKLAQNELSYGSTEHTGVFIGDDGTGFNVANFNTLVAPFGITYATSPTDGSGRTVTGFVPHPVTSGITQLGVDFQLPMT